MAFEVIHVQDWVYVPAPGRMDSFNFETTKRNLESLCQQTKRVALDVSAAHFVNIPMIRFLHEMAKDLNRAGGRLALVGPSEKLKRQFCIFASLDQVEVFSQEAWNKHMMASTPVKRPHSEFRPDAM
jgi:anti-anti-sigma regulatory factor